jgi:hypothetical protein
VWVCAKQITGTNSSFSVKATMPKAALSMLVKAQKVVRCYPSEFCVTPAGDLFCLHCSTIVCCTKKFMVDKHRATAKHVTKVERSTHSSSSTSAHQQFLHVGKTDYAMDVTETFLAADIPLWKLRHTSLRRLFTNIGNPLPSEESCKSRIHQLYIKEMSRICKLIADKPIFLIVDESEVSGSKYLHNPHVTNLCACISLEKSPDAAEVVRAVNDIIPILGCNRQNFCLLLSDASAYMVAAATTLHILYPRLFHITSVAHLLHNCAMKVRNNFPNVDQVIAAVKAACVKNKERQSLFKAIGRPPTPRRLTTLKLLCLDYTREELV